MKKSTFVLNRRGFLIIMVLSLLAAMVIFSGCRAEVKDLSGAVGGESVPGEGYSWSGTWQTNWETLTLTQSGNTVTGKYGHDTGRIDGTVSGNKLTGTWSEAPSYKAPNDAGLFVWHMSSDGNSFTGTWGYGSDDSNGDWTGKRITNVGPLPPIPRGYVPGEEDSLAYWTRYRLEVNRRGSMPDIWLIRTGYRESRDGAALLAAKYHVSVVRNDDTGKFTWSVNGASEEVIEETQAGTTEEIEALRRQAENQAGSAYFLEEQINTEIQKVLDSWD